MSAAKAIQFLEMIQIREPQCLHAQIEIIIVGVLICGGSMCLQGHHHVR